MTRDSSRRWWIALATLVALPMLMGQSCTGLPVISQADCDGLAAVCTEPANASFMAQEVLDLINVERADAGLGPVEWDDTLATIAEDYACEMITYGYFAHANPCLSPSSSSLQLLNRVNEGGYTDYWTVGENLAEGHTSPSEVMTAWMGSATHRQNILNPDWCEVGVGVRQQGNNGLIYWVQEFGQPRDCNN